MISYKRAINIISPYDIYKGFKIIVFGIISHNWFVIFSLASYGNFYFEVDFENVQQQCEPMIY